MRKDVHIFDGQLKDKFIKKFLVIDKLNILSKFITSNPIANNSIQMIIQDMQKLKSANYLESNNMDASDLLMAILQFPQTKDLQFNLEEQLVDMSKGTCNSGRCTRLYQIWSTFKPEIIIK